MDIYVVGTHTRSENTHGEWRNTQSRDTYENGI